MAGKSAVKTEFGDYQTPMSLASAVCAALVEQGIRPASILEPTCGEGAFLLAALDAFPGIRQAIGLEIRPSYAEVTRRAIGEHGYASRTSVVEGDFFTTSWESTIASLPAPLLIVGNPPWVTNAAVGSLGGSNLPLKSNFQGHSGLDAKTGKSNFDISEWMLIRLLHALDRREAVLAMLCKTAVARKVLSYAWKKGLGVVDAAIHRIDSDAAFGVSVDACLLVCRTGSGTVEPACRVFDSLDHTHPMPTIGVFADRLIADAERFRRVRHLFGACPYRWRSGVKHDCRAVMEFTREGGLYRNVAGELADLEEAYLYPLLRGGEIAAGNVFAPSRWALVPQTRVGEDTSALRHIAPKTWQYLVAHGEQLDRRASSIYRKQPRFAIFGVGDYTFTPWKVAVSGLHKRLVFSVLGSFESKPIVLDDTCYFTPCRTRPEAEFVASLLDSAPARDFFDSLVFWESKRPITVDVLGRLDLDKLAEDLGLTDAYATLCADGHPSASTAVLQKQLFE